MGVVGVGMNRYHLTIFDFGLKDAPMRAMGMDAASTHGLPLHRVIQPVGTAAPLLAAGRFCASDAIFAHYAAIGPTDEMYDAKEPSRQICDEHHNAKLPH